jgi:hypothetical protein
MCTSVHFKEKDIFIGTVRGLADTLDVEPTELVWGDEVGEPEDMDFRYCLCPIDVEGSLKKFGYRGHWAENGDPMCFEAIKGK